MAFNITVHHGPFLLVVGTGEAMLADVLAMVDTAARISSTHPYRRVLLDLLGAEPKMEFSDHMAAGMYAANKLAHVERVASVVHQRFRTGSSEKAAQKAGLALRTFTDLKEATDWLST